MSLPEFPIIDDASPRRTRATSRGQLITASCLSLAGHASGYAGYLLVMLIAGWLGFTPPQLLTRSRQASVELQASIAAAPEPSEEGRQTRPVKMPVEKPREKPIERPVQIEKSADSKPAERPPPSVALAAVTTKVPKPPVERTETPPEKTPPEQITEQRPKRSTTKTATVAPVESVESAASVAVDGSQFDEPPQPSVDNLKPPYPPDARTRRLQGVVLLKLRITADGVVEDAVVAESSGVPSFDDSARRTALTWRFTPARLLGMNVAVVVAKPVRFTHPDAT